MSGQRDEFIRAYDEHSDALFRYCLFRVSDREMALDLVQECFMRAWNYLSRGKEVGAMKPFLFKTMHNLIVDEYRRKKSLSLDVLAESGFDPGEDQSGELMSAIDAERAFALLAKLPEEYREVLFLRYVEELPFEEIAQMTGESKNALAVRAHRGIEKLRGLIEEKV